MVIIPPASAASWLPDIAPKLLVFLDDRVTVGVTIGPFAELALGFPSKRGGGALLRVFMADPPVRVRRPGPARRIVPRPLPGVSGDTVSPRAFIGVAPTLLEPPLALLPAAGVAASGLSLIHI